MRVETVAAALAKVLRAYDMLEDLNRKQLHINSIVWEIAMTDICEGLATIAMETEVIDYVDRIVARG